MLRVGSWPVVLAALASGCSVPVASVSSALTGQDGAKVVSGTETVNAYTALATAASAGDTTLTVADGSSFGAGDLVLVVSVQGASIDTTDSTSYGAVTLGPAGTHELWTLTSVTGNVLTLDPGCGLTGLVNAYPLASRPQVVRVPQYTTLSVPSGATLTGQAWNGSTGGFVVVHVQSTADIGGTIDASGLGLRGGAPSSGTTSIGTDVTTYRSTSAVAGEKGESVAGAQVDYDALNGRYGRGAPANGGGGGDGYLAGGGGGASISTSSASAYSGEGTMLSSVTGGGDWTLDPNYVNSDGPGGGRGGYTLSASSLDPSSVAPGNVLWGGNDRNERGGLGGHGLAGAGRLLLGGGGGAGQYDGTSPPALGSAGRGGGVVYLIAATLTGSGTVRADGNAGVNSALTGTSNTAVATGGGAGGGGGGGLVFLRAGGSPSLNVSARGGSGGNVATTGTSLFGVPANGPGGGGAGGGVALQSDLTLSSTPNVSAGLGGTTNSSALSGFPSNGASAGAGGVATTGISASTAPFACLPADVSIALNSSANPVAGGAIFSYSATITNGGPNAAYDLIATITLPSNVTAGAVTAGDFTCTQNAQVLTCALSVLSSGASTSIVLDVTAPSMTATVTTTATIASREDPNAGNNSASVQTNIAQPFADLALTETGPAATAAAENYFYTFTVTNNGPSDAPSLQIVDALPDAFVSATGGGFSCSVMAGTMTCAHGDLAVNASATLTVTVTAPMAATTLTNSGTVSLTSSGTLDNVSSDNNASVTTNVDLIDLSITNVPLFSHVTVGEVVVYAIGITNSSPANVVDASITDQLPSGMQLESASGAGWSCALTGTLIDCTLALLDAQSSSSVVVLLKATSTPGSVSDTATASSPAPDPDLANNTATAIVTLDSPTPGHADVSLTASDAQSPVDLSAPLVYTVTVANAGPDDAAGVQLVGVLPANATFVSATAAGWTCSATGSTLMCAPAASLAAGSSSVITVTLTAPATPGDVDATFVVDATTSDANVDNNSATVTTLVIDPAQIDQPPTITLGSSVTTAEEVPLALGSTITLADPDSGSDNVELDVTAHGCVITLATNVGLTLLAGDGVLDPLLKVQAPIATLNSALMMATITPDPDFVGTATLVLHADDLGHNGAGGAHTADATLPIVVTFVDKPPFAVDDVFTVNANITTNVDVLANDRPGQPGETMMLVAVTTPLHGTASVQNGLVAYTPTPYYVGDDAFSYTNGDGTTSSTGNVIVHVQAYTPPTPDRLSGGCSAMPGSPAHSALVTTLICAALLLRRRYSSW